MKDSFSEMSKRALEIKEKYQEIEPKKWGVEQAMLGLVTDIGELAEIVMANEGYRETKVEVKERLSHELSDVLYSIIVLANKTGIDLKGSFWHTMDSLEERLRSKK